MRNLKTLLFENINTRQTILKNTAWLALGEGVSRLFMFLLLIYAARTFGPREFGVFSFGFAVVSIFVIFSNFGLTHITTRELARDKGNEEDFPGILSLKILLSVGAFILIIGASFLITEEENTRIIIWILGLYILISNFLTIIYSFFRARQRMEYEAGVRILQAALVVGAGVVLITRMPSAQTLSYVLLGGALAATVCTVILFSMFVRSIRVIWSLNIWKKFLKLSWPLGLASMFGVVYLHIDSVMMGFLGQITEVGWYNAAYKIILAIIVPSVLISSSFYPELSKLFKTSRKKFQRTMNYQIEVMFILALPLVAGGLVLAPRIIDFFYGTSFFPAILAFRILIIMAGMNFLYAPFYVALLASHQQKRYFWITLVGATVNILLNIILIPRYSLYGAALATLITSLVLLFLVIEFSRRFVPFVAPNRNMYTSLFIGIISTTIMVVVLTRPVMLGMHVLGMVFVGMVAYLSILLFFLKRGFMGINLKHWST